MDIIYLNKKPGHTDLVGKNTKILNIWQAIMSNTSRQRRKEERKRKPDFKLKLQLRINIFFRDIRETIFKIIIRKLTHSIENQFHIYFYQKTETMEACNFLNHNCCNVFRNTFSSQSSRLKMLFILCKNVVRSLSVFPTGMHICK